MPLPWLLPVIQPRCQENCWSRFSLQFLPQKRCMCTLSLSQIKVHFHFFAKEKCKILPLNCALPVLYDIWRSIFEYFVWNLGFNILGKEYRYWFIWCPPLLKMQFFSQTPSFRVFFMCIVQVLGDLLQKCSYGWIYVLKSSALRSCFLEDILMGSGPTGFHKVISFEFFTQSNMLKFTIIKFILIQESYSWSKK